MKFSWSGLIGLIGIGFGLVQGAAAQVLPSERTPILAARLTIHQISASLSD